MGCLLRPGEDNLIKARIMMACGQTRSPPPGDPDRMANCPKYRGNGFSGVDPDVICIQMLEGFDVNVPLGAFESGEYTVWLNGTQIGEIAH